MVVKMKKKIGDLFTRQGLPPCEKLHGMLRESLKGAGEFAEIFVQNSVYKGYQLSERLISNISNSYSTGAGIRVVKGNNTGYSYTEDLSEASIRKCIADAVAIAGSAKSFAAASGTGKNNLYDVPSSVNDNAGAKVDLLRRAEKKAFAVSPLVEKVEVFLGESQSTVLILNSAGLEVADVRPMISLGISVIVNRDNVREGAYHGGGGRKDLSYFKETTPEELAEESVRQALLLLDAKPAPAGEMEVVLGAGESGILLHESIGHPLEADFNFRGSSAFSDKMGKKVASDQCTIIDRGDMPNERGAINIDDEGNDSGKTVLIEKGVLKSYMYDTISANHYGVDSMNGRRESFREIPLPRMTNTYMLAGDYSQDEIFKSVKKGIYAKSFSGGQVDISCGDFVFSITEGYMIEDGKIGHPIKGASLIGNGPEILKRVEMVGNDLVISDGKWTCGKEGQSVPVGVGMPTVKLSNITVGGTQND